MTSDSTVVLTDEYLTAAETLRRNKRIREHLDSEDTHARDIITKILAEGDTGINEHGEILIKVRPGAHVFNEDTARANLPPELLTQITTTITEERVDKTLARDLLSQHWYTQCCKQNKPTVVIP